MKVAIYHNLPSGGAKRALHEMASRLHHTHDIDVYTLRSAEHNFCDLRSFCRCHHVYPFVPFPLAHSPLGRVNQAIRTMDLLRLYALQKQIARDIDSQGYDLVFAHVCRFAQSPSVLQFLKTPSVYYCPEPPRLLYERSEDRPEAPLSLVQRISKLLDPLPGIYRRTLTAMDRKSVLSATTVLVNSHYSRETLYHIYGILPAFSRLGVDTTRFRPLGTDKNHVVLSVGALTAKKGFDFLLRSLAYIEVDQRPALVIVSNYTDLQERAYLQKLADELSVTVTFCEGIPDEDLIRLYNQAILTVYAPIMEPFGFVPLESMACGTPVVGVREAGVRETVQHGETGLLTERDPAQFADAVSALLRDDDRRMRLGQNARVLVENEWSWERSVKELERWFQRTTEK